MTGGPKTAGPAGVQAALDAHPFWYHTMDVGPGAVTPGWFDLRHALSQLPWPDVRGKRCLDIGTFDGLFAFEMERRGAQEVVAIDVGDHLAWDWPPDYRASDLPRDPGFAGPPKGTGFELVKQLTGSRVQWRPLSIYDLDAESIGTFDLVVCGSLLLHLRDPLRALEAVRRVTAGHFLSSEQIELGLTLASPRRPRFSLQGSGGSCQWFNFNSAGHWRLLYAAGFEITGRSRPFIVRFDRHPSFPPGWRSEVRRAGLRAVSGDRHPGILHRALLGRPRV